MVFNSVCYVNRMYVKSGIRGCFLLCVKIITQSIGKSVHRNWIKQCKYSEHAVKYSDKTLSLISSHRYETTLTHTLV